MVRSNRIRELFVKRSVVDPHLLQMHSLLSSDLPLFNQRVLCTSCLEGPGRLCAEVRVANMFPLHQRLA